MEIQITENKLYRHKKTRKVYIINNIVGNKIKAYCKTVRGVYFTGFKTFKNRFIPYENFNIEKNNLYKSCITLETIYIKEIVYDKIYCCLVQDKDHIPFIVLREDFIFEYEPKGE